jgi:alkylation response protein AidB-like acyl-CoA dehydrogenase
MDLAPSPNQLRLRDVAHRFAQEEVQPWARAVERDPDPARRLPTELVRTASKLGLRLLTLPIEMGGQAADTLTQVIVLEELCAGDVGFGLALMHVWREGWILHRLADDNQRERFLKPLIEDDTQLTALAMTESDAGSDVGLPYVGSLTAGPMTAAVLDGEQWVLNGHKRYITNASNAGLVLVIARTDRSVVWTEGTSLFAVPAGTPGMHQMPPEDALGANLRLGGDIVFEECRIPSGNLLGPLNGFYQLHLGRGNKVKEATKALGVGRAALEGAVEEARRRVQGGRPIIEHQLVAGSLADMATEIEMARSLIWRTAWAVDNDPDAAVALEDMAKIAATEIVINVATRALQVWGHAGALTRNPIEKLVRDAAVMLLPPIGNSAARARLGGWIADHGLSPLEVRGVGPAE